MKNTNKKILLFASAVFFFFGISLNVGVKLIPKAYSLYEGEKELVFRIDLEGVRPVFAASGNWSAVRDVTTFVKNVVKGVDSVVQQLATSSVLALTSSVTGVSGIYTYKYNPGFNGSVTNSQGVAKTYKKSFEFIITSTNAKVFELYFDDATNKTSGNGVLVIWQPNKFDSALNQTNTAKMECSQTGSTTLTMICSWNGGPFEASGGVVDNGRIKVDYVSATNTLSLKGIARILVASDACSGGNRDYYALAFVNSATSTTSTQYATAQLGLNDGSVNTTICGSAAANTFNSAFFNSSVNTSATDNSKYFVSDGNSSDVSPYPSIATVSALFLTMTNATDSEMTKTVVDNTSVSFKTSSGFN
ncbi:MAG: hypothetical protein K8R21_13850 [Leptospira sp.]|nr:hypothetical protein [Leptospira sp.]